MTRRFARNTALSALAVAALATVGCNRPYSSSTHSAFVANPTPTVAGLVNRNVDIDSQIAITNDTNFRLLQEDLLKLGLLDRPRRTSKYAIPY